VGRIPLKTRGQGDEIAVSDISLIDSVMIREYAAIFPKILEKRLVPL
jgi:hypothetical protein